MAYQQNAIQMAFCWWADGGPLLYAYWVERHNLIWLTAVLTYAITLHYWVHVGPISWHYSKNRLSLFKFRRNLDGHNKMAAYWRACTWQYGQYPITQIVFNFKFYLHFQIDKSIFRFLQPFQNHMHHRYITDIYISSLEYTIIASNRKFIYSKTCVKWPLKNKQTKILMTNGSLMKVKSIADCSPWSTLQRGAFCNTFDLH